MDRIVCSIRKIFMCILLISFSQCALCSEYDSPENIVEGFYRTYLNEPSQGNLKLIEKYVSRQLIQSIRHSFECNYDSEDSSIESENRKLCSKKRECKDYRGNHICDWNGVWIETDVDYFTKSQDIYPSWKRNVKTVTISQSNSESLIDVSLGGGTDPVMNLKVKMIRNGDLWKVISVTE
jgi:hypothetical protein